MNRISKIFIVIVAVILVFAVYHEFVKPIITNSSSNTISGNHTLLVMGADPSEKRPGPGACDMALIVNVENTTITNVTSLYPGGMAHPTLSPPAEAAAQGDTQLYLHDSLWWTNTTYDAQVAQQIVEYNTGIQTDGVVIIKTEALDAMVQAVGPIYVSGEGQVPNTDVIDFLRQEQENGMTRGNAVQSVGNAIKNATHDKTKRHKLIQVVTDQYSKGNIIVVPQSLYTQFASAETLNKLFSF